jgi:putative ABC transport system permease protein
MDDADAIVEISGVSAVAQQINSNQQVTAKGTNTNTSIYGVTDNYALIRNIELAAGSFVAESQNQSAAKVAVLGPTTMIDLFGEDADPSSVVGQKIRIKGSEFKIIGVTVSKGSSGFNNQDDLIYIPVKTAARYLSGNNYLSSISVQAESAEVMTQLQEDITSLLLTRHRKTADSADFTVQNQADLLSSLSSISSTLTLLLGAIAGISLLVGGIGIMNMMLTNVTERTREIGLRKAIGAKRSDISRQFLVEAIALTVIGGTIGVVLGTGIALAVNLLGFVTTSISWNSIVLAFGVSAAIGIVFGWYPARRASRLNPIEALRYE